MNLKSKSWHGAEVTGGALPGQRGGETAWH